MGDMRNKRLIWELWLLGVLAALYWVIQPASPHIKQVTIDSDYVKMARLVENKKCFKNVVESTTKPLNKETLLLIKLACDYPAK